MYTVLPRGAMERSVLYMTSHMYKNVISSLVLLGTSIDIASIVFHKFPACRQSTSICLQPRLVQLHTRIATSELISTSAQIFQLDTLMCVKHRTLWMHNNWLMGLWGQRTILSAHLLRDTRMRMVVNIRNYWSRSLMDHKVEIRRDGEHRNGRHVQDSSGPSSKSWLRRNGLS